MNIDDINKIVAVMRERHIPPFPDGTYVIALASDDVNAVLMRIAALDPTDELWAAIGAGIRKQGRCIRITGSDDHPHITTPLRRRKKPRRAHWLAYIASRASTTS